MKHKWVRVLLSYVLAVVLGTMLTMGVRVLVNGMYLPGVPKISEVNKVTVSAPELTDELKEVTDSDKLELAVKLTGFLKYSLFNSADATKQPQIEITYYLNNGGSISVAANGDTVWWKGKTYAVKDKDMFVQLTEGLFFLRELSGQG